MERQNNRLLVLACDRRLGVFAICSEDLYLTGCARRRNKGDSLVICGAHVIVSYCEALDEPATFRLGDPRLTSRIPDEGDDFLVASETGEQILRLYLEELESLRAQCGAEDDDYLGLFEAINAGGRFAAAC